MLCVVCVSGLILIVLRDARERGVCILQWLGPTSLNFSTFLDRLQGTIDGLNFPETLDSWSGLTRGDDNHFNESGLW